ncbi:MAG: glycosyltransferase family 2 protein [Alistipes sp.]|nr:glycosyltransferase family 2 protein [Alistipes sp.]
MSKTKIVILNWNGEEHLERFLPSVVRSVEGVEGVSVVVADNGSTDASLALLQRDFPTVEVVRLDKNYGFAEGYNRALQQVEADYYILLNSDVETPRGWIEPLVQCLDEHPEVAACAPKLRYTEERENFEYAGASGGYIDFLGYPFCRGRILRAIECDEGQYDDERDLFWVSGAAYCCRAELFHRMGGFDGDYFAHMEEIDLSWRLQLKGWKIRIVPQSVVYHYGGGTLKTDSPRKIQLNHRNNLAMLFKCGSPLQCLLVLLLRPGLDCLAALTYLAQGHTANFKAVFRAWWEVLGWYSELKKKRRQVRSDVAPEGDRYIYRSSILWQYLIGNRRAAQLRLPR